MSSERGERMEMLSDELSEALARLEQLEGDDKLWRELLWLHHGCEGLYGDDGEMQCGMCIIDFKTDSPQSIRRRWIDRGLAKLNAMTPEQIAAIKQPALGPNPSVAEIVREYLVREKYDGLYAPSPPILETPYSICRAGYLQNNGSIGPEKE